MKPRLGDHGSRRSLVGPGHGARARGVARAAMLPLVLGMGGIAPDSAGAETGSPFRPVVLVEEEQALHLTLLGDTPLIAYDRDGLALASLGPRGIVRDERWSVGISHCGPAPTTRFSGRFPGAAWLVRDLHAWSACPDDDAHLLHWTGSAWRMVATVDAHNVLAAPWQHGSALVAEVPRRSGPPLGYELYLLSAGPGLEAPRPKPAPRPTGQAGPCYTELEGPVALTTGEDGSALVVGTSRCWNDDREREPRPVAEYFAPRARRGRILAPPVRWGPDAALAFVPTARGLWVGGTSASGRSQLARWDGATWSKILGPPGQLVSFSVDGVGTLWALAQVDDAKTVWRRRGTGTWTRVPLPKDAHPIDSLHVRRGGDAWLVAGRAIYSTWPAREILRWPAHACDEAEQARADREADAINAVKPRNGTSAAPCCEEPVERPGR